MTETIIYNFKRVFHLKIVFFYVIQKDTTGALIDEILKRFG